MKNLQYILLSLALLLGYGQIKAQSEDTSDEAVAMARQKIAEGDADGAFTYIDIALPMRTFCTPFSLQRWAEVVNLKASAYALKYDWQKAIKVGQDAYLALRSNPKGIIYAETMYNLASFHAGRAHEDDNAIAINYARAAREQFGRKSIGYFSCVNDLAYYYMRSGYQEDAQSMAADAIRYGAELFEDNKELEKQLWSKATSFAELDNREAYDLACTYALATIGSMENNADSTSHEYVRRLIKTAGYYFQRREFPNEITMLLKAAPAAKTVMGEQSLEYVDCLRKLALAYNHHANELSNTGRKKDSEASKQAWEQTEYYEGLAREILISTNRLDEIRTPQIPLISNQAMKLHSEKKLDDAIRYEQVAYVLYSKYNNMNGKAHSASNLSMFYNDKQNNDSVLKYAHEAVEIYDTLKLESKHEMELAQTAYHTAALYFHNAKDDASAIKYSLKSIAILEESGDTLDSSYPLALHNIVIYYSSIGNKEKMAYYDAIYQKADKMVEEYTQQKQLADINKNVKGRKNKQKAREELELAAQNKTFTQEMVLENWSRVVNASEVEDIHSYYQKVIEGQRQVILQDFPSMSKEEQQKTWGTIRKRDATDYIEYAYTLAYSYSYNDSIVCDTWNALILDDGVNDFLRTGDKASVSRTWKDVQQQLDDNTLLIRFFITMTSDNANPYSAFLLRKGWTSPKATSTFYESEITPISYADGTTVMEKMMTPEGKAKVISDHRVGKMIWDYILKAVPDMESVKTIKYNVVGLLKELDPGQLCTEEGNPMNKKYSMIKQ